MFESLPQIWLRRCSLIVSEAWGGSVHLREELVKVKGFAHLHVVEKKNSRSSDLTGLFQPLAAAWVSPMREVSVCGSIRVLPCHIVAIMLCQDHFISCGEGTTSRKDLTRPKYKLPTSFGTISEQQAPNTRENQAPARTESKANQQDSNLLPNSGTRGRAFESPQARHPTY